MFNSFRYFCCCWRLTHCVPSLSWFLRISPTVVAHLWKSHMLVCVCFSNIIIIHSLIALFGFFDFFFFFFFTWLLFDWKHSITDYNLYLAWVYFTNQTSCLMVQLRLLGNCENRMTAHKVSQHSSSKFQIALQDYLKNIKDSLPPHTY